jgi:hypothetical protein
LHITKYFRELEEVIAKFPGIRTREINYETRTPYIGFIKGSLFFRDGSVLHFKEFVDTEGEVKKYVYGYHYQRGDQLEFRYDNHRGDEHKHVKDEKNIVFAKPPNLIDVLKEIAGSRMEVGD